MGWRARIGALYPADGDQDGELWRFLPDGVSLHLTRSGAPAGELTVEKIVAEAESTELEAHARLLTTIRLDCIAYLCAAMSFIRGPGYDQEIVRRLETATGLPATTTSTALVKALHHLSVCRLAVVAPYPAPITERLVWYLEENGIEVVACQALELPYASQYGGIAPAEMYRLVQSADRAEAEGVFISCTGLRTVDILEALEQDLSKPVLSANQITLWHSLALAGVRARMAGLGQLYNVIPGS